MVHTQTTFYVNWQKQKTMNSAACRECLWMCTVRVLVHRTKWHTYTHSHRGKYKLSKPGPLTLYAIICSNADFVRLRIRIEYTMYKQNNGIQAETASKFSLLVWPHVVASCKYGSFEVITSMCQIAADFV